VGAEIGVIMGGLRTFKGGEEREMLGEIDDVFGWTL
jgi:hypothetical protein